MVLPRSNFARFAVLRGGKLTVLQNALVWNAVVPTARSQVPPPSNAAEILLRPLLGASEDRQAALHKALQA